MRYEMTSRENIAVGRIEYLSDIDRIRSAAEQSLADGVIDRLAGSYEQMFGRRFEGGVDFSGGEWQKLALARAYLREAQVLILDEPTAALDARAEFEVFQRFNELTTATWLSLFLIASRPFEWLNGSSYSRMALLRKKEITTASLLSEDDTLKCSSYKPQAIGESIPDTMPEHSTVETNRANFDLSSLTAAEQRVA